MAHSIGVIIAISVGVFVAILLALGIVFRKQ